MDKGISRDELEAIRDNYTELVESFSTEYTRLENQNKEQAAEIDRLTELVEMQNKEYIELDNECREQKTEIERLTALVEKISIKKSVIETKGFPLCKTCPELKDCPHADNRTSCWEYDEIVKQSDSRLDAIRKRALKAGMNESQVEYTSKLIEHEIKMFERLIDGYEIRQESNELQAQKATERFMEKLESGGFNNNKINNLDAKEIERLLVGQNKKIKRKQLTDEEIIAAVSEDMKNSLYPDADSKEGE